MVKPDALGLTVLAGTLAAAAVLSACSPTNHRVVLDGLRTQLAHQYHACVPLGWNPVPAAGTYYPGTSVEFLDLNSWLPALWIGKVRTSDLGRPEVRATYDVLNELVRVGMLARSPVADGVRYRLTSRATPYYFDDSQYGNNPEHISYLCYSSIVPQRVTANEPVQLEPDRDGAGELKVFRATFEWRPSPAASWADDPLLRSHSVVLPPTNSPLVAKFVYWDGAWQVASLSASAPTQAYVADASVWPKLRR